MAISDTITSMYENVGNVYDVLELAGADLTNVDKNIFNLKETWEERLLYFLANGTDVIWNNWLPKINGTGETITLNNTIEAKMDFVYKGNTYQYSTTGKNKSHFDRISQTGITFDGNDIDILNPTNYVYANDQWNMRNDSSYSGKTYTIYLLINGTKESGKGFSINIGKTGSSYAFQYSFASATTTYNNVEYINTITLGENEVFTSINCYVGSPLTANINVKFMVVEGSYTLQTIGDYEPYTNGPSPNPDYPQDIQVVSGDNTIKVEGKNLFDDSVERKSAFTTGDVGQQVGYGSSSVTYSYVNCAYLQANTTYTISWNKNTPANTSARDSVIVDENNIILEKPQIWTNNRETYTFTPTHNGYLIFVYDINTTNIQLELGSTATTYEPYQTPQTYPINLGNIELCKIGDYQDKIAKSTGKNLFDKSAIEEGKRLGGDGLPFVDTSFDLSDYIKVDSNTQYTYSRSSNGSGSSAIAYYDSSKTFISRTMPIMDSNARKIVLTTPNNATYVRIADLKTTLDSMQFEKGSSSSSYEPYGKVWYLNKQIGKVVLDGSENITSNPNGTNSFFIPIPNSLAKNDTLLMISNGFKGIKYNDRSIGGNNTIYAENIVDKATIRNTTFTTLELFTTWLGTHNTVVYYVLNTPTYTEITDNTLISQLEAFKKSYNTQTSISQVNNDLPFILDVVALGELEI